MKGKLVRVSLLVAVCCAIASAPVGCAAKRVQTGLDRLESADLADPESVQTEQERLMARAGEFFDVCVADKFTSKITYERLERFFESSKERDAFVATFAARLRKAGVRGDRLKSYEIERVAIARNEAVGFVRARLKGHFWGPFNAELVEVVVWKRRGAEWFVWPQQHSE